MRHRRWTVLALAIVLARFDAAAQDAATYVRSWDGEEWAARLVGYDAGALVIITATGWRCTVPFEKVDWEATTRRNGTAIDLLRLPGIPAPAAVCEDTASGPSIGDGSSPPVPPSFPPADTERDRAVAVRGSARPVLNGVLDDAVWSDAIPFGEFFQSERRVGEPASERTEIRVLYDADNLYFGIRSYDSSPDLIVARNMIREGPLQSDDSITILLDPLHDHRTAYLFGTNANGMRTDANLLGSRQSDVNRDWDGVWNVVARRDSEDGRRSSRFR